MLDLAWPNAAPYPANTTVPGGMLRLTTEGGNVTAAFLYTDLSKDDGTVVEAEALFANGQASITLEEIRALGAARIDQKCVRLTEHRTPSAESATLVEEGL